MRRLPEEQYHELAAGRGFEFIGPYTGRTKDKTEWRCMEGHTWQASYSSIAYMDSGCPYCAGRGPLFVQDYHALAESVGATWVGCTLPPNVMTKTDWVCSNGHRWRSHYNNIQQGRGCPECALESVTGECSPWWNPNLSDAQRERRRLAGNNEQWRKAVYKRDNYTCQICNQYGRDLVAHHIYGYAEYPEMRTDLANGLTMCTKHHNDFHGTYGYMGFGALDLQDFIARQGVHSE